MIQRYESLIPTLATQPTWQRELPEQVFKIDDSRLEEDTGNIHRRPRGGTSYTGVKP
jgi:hypothetical protein